ncbi:hypothetical protein LOC68_25250 [Blastopirellula sp. JC732]|uniref:Uncharacterized protein n=1 Tax=Blastopirellula sediminis TaxID=2894196 RepID=A0A9X1MTC5_9BACT|nr:hypothetical protein [Blastopirellula sediminis]MCC9604983.1 hypothetical protein [Blastopirellula sediminis]MCC9631717.1 hypothetical protein [Blastopirellula sediminis]
MKTFATFLVSVSAIASAVGVIQAKEPISLHIVADIDGSDRLSVSAREIFWVHRHWDWPNLVKINDFEWSPRSSPVLGEQVSQRLLAESVDFASAKMTVRQGRDTVVLETFDDHILIHFADSPNGRSNYDLTITFDRAEPVRQRRKRTKEGVVGMAYVNGENANVVFRYFNGKVLAPSNLKEADLPPWDSGASVQINFHGALVLPKETTVRIRHAGGSSTRGHATLSVDGKVIETLGDDLKKVSEQLLELGGGSHAVQWQISGGDIGHCFLQFAESESGALLPLVHTSETLEQLELNPQTRFLDVRSEQTGWPIPAGW